MRNLILVCFLATVYAKHELYTGWKSYFVGPSSAEQLKTFQSLIPEYDVDVLSSPLTEREGVVLIKPNHQAGFTKALEDIGMTYRVHSEDIKTTLDKEDSLFETRRKATFARNGGRSFPYNDYQDINEIYNYVDDIAARYPNLVTLVHPANTFEGRPIKFLKISTTNFEVTTKPIIFIDAGIHAREWIGPSTAIYAIHKLVENNTDASLLDDFDWIIVPVVNPDGYQFTHTSNRFWRKTRSTDTHPLSRLCPGVDGNRNYDFYWDQVGTTPGVPCSDHYAGNAPFSEVETRVIRDLLQENLNRISLYITLHSYGSMILIPWGHNGSLSSNHRNLYTVGIAMGDAMDALALPGFPKYAVGNSVKVIGYACSGAADDYAHSIGVPLVYTIELPGSGFSYDGIHLDPLYIEYVAQQTWAGFVAGAKVSNRQEIFKD